MTKQRAIRLTAIVLALLMPILAATVAWGTEGEAPAAAVKYASPDINELMGAGQEPEDISVSAGAQYQTKNWYEYVLYSEHAVCSYRCTDTSRLLFYDPYTYTNTLVMDVEFDATTTEFDTMSSYSVTHTSSKAITSALSTTYTSSEATQTSGRDVTHSGVKNSGTTKTTYNHKTKSTDRGEIIGENRITHETLTSATELGKKGGLVGIVASETITIGIDTTQQHNHTTYNDHGTTVEYTGSDEVENNTSSTTDGWTELSARVTKTTGSSTSNTTTWSETTTTSVTKTYAATHFASDGVTSLPWAIVHYRVQMPMKCCLQVKVDGEWTTISTIYMLMTTVQGTCRAWMQNGQVYYEDWGSGEPVVETDFWSQFMTKDQLIDAYSNKLYPTGGAG